MTGLRPCDVKVAILAGGLATRLGAATRGMPKSMVEVAGRPFVEYQLEELSRQGVRRAVLCVGYLGEKIEAHLGREACGVGLEYSYDGAHPLGTAGALRRAWPILGPVFYVLYGDALLQVDYGAVLAKLADATAVGVMAVLRNQGRWDASNVRFAAGRLLRYDKRKPSTDMEHIDYGLSVLREEALAGIPDGEPCELGDVYRDLVARGRLLGYEVRERFYEIGSPAGLRETRAFLCRSPGGGARE